MKKGANSLSLVVWVGEGERSGEVRADFFCSFSGIYNYTHLKLDRVLFRAFNWQLRKKSQKNLEKALNYDVGQTALAMRKAKRSEERKKKQTNLPRHVLKLIAEWLHRVIGVFNLRYAEPLK